MSRLSGQDVVRQKIARALLFAQTNRWGLVREFNGTDYSTDAYIVRMTAPRIVACCGVATASCTGVPSAITNLQVNLDSLDGGTYISGLTITWDPITGSDRFVATCNFPIVTTTVNSDTSVSLLVQWGFGGDFSDIIVTITASNDCGSSTADAPGLAPCFLAGSLVHMADGTTRAIENVAVGDMVIGAFGEYNPVLALHRPLLGDKLMCLINGEHSTTNHHPHVSVDRKFYCGDLASVNNQTYGRSHIVIDGDGHQVLRYLQGLNPRRIGLLLPGIELKTIDGGRLVQTADTYSLPPDTQLYNLVIGGSHTYHVDDYAVTGWPREDDFDYDTWTPKRDEQRLDGHS